MISGGKSSRERRDLLLVRPAGDRPWVWLLEQSGRTSELAALAEKAHECLWPVEKVLRRPEDDLVGSCRLEAAGSAQ